MKASEVIKVLQELIKDNGDVETKIATGAFFVHTNPIRQIYYDENDKVIIIDE